MKRKSRAAIRERALVTLTDGFDYSAYPFCDDLPLVYLGEIANMPEHGIFAGTRTGRVYAGYHLDHFRELDEDEV